MNESPPTPRPIDAVIFDLDGTLADTLRDIAASMNRALADLGLPTHPTHAYLAFIGEGVTVLAERALPPDRADLIPDAVEGFRVHYARHCFDTTGPFPGVPELLDALADRGVRLAVLSNKPDPATRYVVERLFDRWHFDAVRGQRDDTPRKPDPAGALIIAETLNLPPARVAFVGDSKADMLTARAAGMYAVGVLWGFRGADELLAHGADILIESPADLLPLLAETSADRAGG